MPRLSSPAELEVYREEISSARDPKKPCITLCSGTACHATGSNEVAVAIERELETQGLKGEVDFRRTGCHGFCEKGPVVVIDPEEICYLQVTPEDVPELITSSVKDNKIVDRLTYKDPGTGERIAHESEIPFYKHQERIVFGANRRVAPHSFEDFIANDGGKALVKALFELTPEQVISEVKEAKLRGRGGAGFEAGVKWEFARNAQGEPKYVVVNCDEGDPGAYMDRSLLELSLIHI